jgi:hypothetical protein
MCRIANSRRLLNLLITLKNYFVWEFFVVDEQPLGMAGLDTSFSRIGGTFPGQCGRWPGLGGRGQHGRVTIGVIAFSRNTARDDESP